MANEPESASDEDDNLTGTVTYFFVQMGLLGLCGLAVFVLPPERMWLFVAGCFVAQAFSGLAVLGLARENFRLLPLFYAAGFALWHADALLNPGGAPNAVSMAGWAVLGATWLTGTVRMGLEWRQENA